MGLPHMADPVPSCPIPTMPTTRSMVQTHFGACEDLGHHGTLEVTCQQVPKEASLSSPLKHYGKGNVSEPQKH